MKRPSLPIIHAIYMGLFLLSLAACKPDANVCENNDDCQIEGTDGDVCIQGMCQQCIDNTQCVASVGENAVCNEGRCEQQAAALQPQCTVNVDCQSGESCTEGACVKSVMDAAAMVGRSCNQNPDCAGGYCVAGTCSLDPDPKLEFQNKCREFFAQTNTMAKENKESVYFEFNDDALTTGGREKLEFTAECLKKLDNVTLVLEGHADDRGAPEYTLGLGDKRARNVLQYLTNLGVAETRLDWRSKGENEPLCMNPTEDCWAQNRRVELIAR